MKKYTFFFIILFASSSIFSQDLDSLEILSELEQYEFTDDSSVESFWSFLLENDSKLSTVQQVDYRLKCAKYAKQFNKDTLFIEYNLQITRLFLSQGEIQKSKDLLKNIEQDVEVLNSTYYSGYFYSLSGNPYAAEGDYIEAIKFYTKAIALLRNSEIPEKTISPLFNIANIYAILGEYENSIKYSLDLLSFNKYLSQEESLVNSADAYYRMSDVYQYYGEEKRDSVFHYLDKSIEFVEKFDSPQDYSSLLTHCNAYLFASKLYLEDNEFTKAADYFEKAAICEGKIEPQYTVALADFYINTGAYAQARALLNDTVKLDVHITGKFVRHDLEARYYEGIGDFKKALGEYKEANKIEEEFRKKEKVQYAAYTAARFDAAKREEEIKALTLKGEAETLKFRILLFVLLMSLLLIALGILAYRKLKQSKNTIELQSKELKKIDALKSKLFTNISHELRTPLTLISAPIDNILREVELTENDRKQLLLAKKSSEQLLSISNQLMDLTKNEIGEIKLNLSQLNWTNLLTHVLSTYQVTAENKGLSLVETKHYTEDSLLQTDPVKLKVILVNLLENAIKYNKKGGEIHLVSKNSDSHLTFSVKDTGIGIKDSELPLIFNRYYQSKSSTEAAGGFGIGLAVCQEYVKLLGGTIEVKSILGKGTTVIVNIPKTIATSNSVADYTFDTEVEPINPITKTSKQNIVDEEAKHLLIVEDNIDLREFLKTILSSEYTLSFASNGLEALKKLEKFNPSLIITDWMMPVMNGLEFLEKLKEDSRFNSIPVLMLTTRSLKVDQLKAFQKGVDDYLLKPFETEQLKIRIENLLDFKEEKRIANLPDDDSIALDVQNQKDMQWIKDLEKIIQENISDFDLNLDKVALKMDISKLHLNRKVKAITGLTPMKFIDEIRFWEARRLLEEKEVSAVKVAAYSVGFKSVKNFSRNFKKRFGKYPSDY